MCFLCSTLGFFSAIIGQSACTPCFAGFASASPQLATTCDACVAGRYAVLACTCCRIHRPLCCAERQRHHQLPSVRYWSQPRQRRWMPDICSVLSIIMFILRSNPMRPMLPWNFCIQQPEYRVHWLQPWPLQRPAQRHHLHDVPSRLAPVEPRFNLTN